MLKLCQSLAERNLYVCEQVKNQGILLGGFGINVKVFAYH